MMLRRLPLKLLLVAAVLCFLEGDAKFGESGARRRRCLNGSPPRRLKKRERRLLLLDEPASGAELLPCRGHYPRLSCCARAGRHGLLLLPAATKVGTASFSGSGTGGACRSLLSAPRIEAVAGHRLPHTLCPPDQGSRGDIACHTLVCAPPLRSRP